ncbi:MAG TPA: SDR family oxidoreductase [Fimbriimonas sp.]|nr:SDR family oxidoreductase [Fimbriimonas sp.]
MQNWGLEGQIALVTGASKGIGRGCALELAKAGCSVALGLHSVSRDNGLVDEIQALGVEALPLQLDVQSKSEIDTGVQQAIKRFGRIDILVNNAGGGRIGLATDVTEEDFDFIVDANFKGTFFVSQAVGRHMIRQKSGRVVNIGSQAGATALRTESVYCAAKAAVAHLTKCLAVEWGEYGVRVNCVAPTFIRTPGTEAALSDPEFSRYVTEEKIVLGRVGEIADVTGAVMFLCSEASSLVTGATLLVDGGWTIH